MPENLFSEFCTSGTFESASPFGAGHINDTYLVKTRERESLDYIFQRINTQIFTQPRELMTNVLRVTEHLRAKLIQAGDKHVEQRCLTVVLSVLNEPVVVDEKGDYWACYLYIKNSYAHDVVKNTKQAREGGKLIGRFLELLSDFPSDTLHETLPQFHNVDYRLNNFERAVLENANDRVKSCQWEVDFVRANAAQMKQVMMLGASGNIPLRVVHNDTKFNNLLLDADDNGLCVIDLDTVMPGFVHYDFSDAVRTVGNSAAEDERSLEKIQFDLGLFAAFCEGFFVEMRGSLTREEIDSLADAVPLMPFIQGVRFLTDHLSGDSYFKIHFAGHNLQRARAQFQLVRCMQQEMLEISRIIQGLA